MLPGRERDRAASLPMKRILTSIVFAIVVWPSLAAGHASPLSSFPESSSRLAVVPAYVSIQFSERLDDGASSIVVRGPDGSTVSPGRAYVDQSDRRRLTVDVNASGEGAYIVSWSVVSSDDGHFTRGSFPFVVGDAAALPDMQSGNFEIVHVSTGLEAVAMTVELFGNGLIWAALLIFSLAVRPLIRSGRFSDAAQSLMRGYAHLVFIGASMALVGGAAQIAAKSQDLASIQNLALLEALQVYIGTTAGEATLYRMLAVAFVTLVFAVFRRAIMTAPRFTWQEGLVIAGMSVFAYFRAVVSHATANPFIPELSVAINFVHLIEKDFWAGAASILVLLLVLKRFKSVFAPLMHQISIMLSVNLMLVALTGAYIVWLHLRTFDNLFATQWGLVFMQLLIVAVALVGVRTYHVVTRVYRPVLFSKLLPATLSLEAALALAVVFYSSVAIITSPPLPDARGPVYSQSDEGITVDLRASVLEDRVALLSLTGGTPLEPSVTVSGESVGTVVVVPEVAFAGGYRLPLSLMQADEELEITVRVPQEGAYDAIVSFSIPSNGFELKAHAAQRSFDSFALSMALVAIGAFAYAYVVFRLSRRAVVLVPVDRFAYPVAVAIVGFVLGLVVITRIAIAYAGLPISNPYKAQCEADGNMWHLMLPMKAGIPLSETPREGCMWGMGNYQYMFADEREYDYVNSYPPAFATLDFESGTLIAGVPQDFTVSVRYPDGTPANLFVDMEKLVHVVIVSRDQRHFAHIHPDDMRDLTESEKESATFSLSYTFPRAGEYLISVDYANGIRLESAQQSVTVVGAPAMESDTALYASPARVGDYDVAMSYTQPFAGEVSTLVYEIHKEGQPAVLEPYLSAAMHIAVIKNDLEAFAHTHGEVHPPGVAMPPVIVRDGKIVHSMATMYTPPSFAYPIDAHVIFPEPGLYTVWAQFQSDGEVYAVPFTVRVE